MAVRKMLAWIKEPDKEGLTKVRRNIPKAADDSVLVKVKAAGICEIDFDILKGYLKVNDNLIPGHEFCGEIAAVGRNVKGFEIGDLVVQNILNGCGEYWPFIQSCDARSDGPRTMGIHIDGSFAEYIAAPPAALHKVPREIDVQAAASIEPVALAYSAVKKAGIFLPGASIIIFGPCAVGLYTSQIARLAGANVVVVGSEGDEKRLLLAQSAGIHTVNNSVQDLDEVIRILFPKGKADIVIDATGVAGIVGGMPQYLLPHGQLILAGVYKDRSSVNPLEIVRGDIAVKGTFCYTLSDFEGAIQLVLDQRIDFHGIVDTFPLSQLKEGFENAMSKKSLKAVLIP